MAIAANHAKLRRRWVRFSLRTVLVLLATLCLALGLWVKPRLDQHAAIAAVKRAGGDFYLEEHYDSFMAKSAALIWNGRRQRPQSQTVRNLPRSTPMTGAGGRVQQFTFATPASPGWRERLFGEHYFSRVAAISFPYHPRETIDTRRLSRVKTLRWLNISGTRINDDDLQILSRLPKLEFLGLADTHISDAGLAHVVMLNELENLDLSGTEVTDHGLSHLARLKDLQRLSLIETLVTSGGIESFQRPCPAAKWCINAVPETLELQGTMTTAKLSAGPRRTLCCLHASTWLMLVISAAALALLILPAEFIGAESMSTPKRSGGLMIWYKFEHGWPWPFLQREVSAVTFSSSIPDRGVHWLHGWGWSFAGGLSTDKLPYDFPRGKWQPWLLAGDACVSAAILLAVAAVVEWRRSRGRMAWQFSLAELFGLTIVVSGALGWWVTQRWLYEAEQRLIPDVDFKQQNIALEYCGPAWLRRTVGEHNLPHFRRVTAVTLDDAIRGFLPQQRVIFPAGQLLFYSGPGADGALIDVPRFDHAATPFVGSRKITDETLSQVGQFSHLEALTIPDGINITSIGLEHLSKLQQLSYLHINGIHINGRALNVIGQINSLSSLHLSEGWIEASGISSLVRLRKLHTLTMNNVNLSRTDLSVLLQCEALDVLVWNQQAYRGREAITTFVRSD